MKHERSLRFDSLETRKLLSKAHVSVAHARPAAVAPAALVLNGTLTVDNKASLAGMDEQGDTTTSTPVAGQLGALGEVHGVWVESSDQYGDYVGPDTLQLRTSKGTFQIAFNEQNTKVAHRVAHGPVNYVDAQSAHGDTGAYARASERGSIELATNSARSFVTSMTITTTTK